MGGPCLNPDLNKPTIKLVSLEDLSMEWVLDDHREVLLILLGVLMCEGRSEQFKYACYVRKCPYFF